jgi:hypothetical protein
LYFPPAYALADEVFLPAYKAGARVVSNSWGSFDEQASEPLYKSGAKQIDAMVYEHDDLLVVFAAGNEQGIEALLLKSNQLNFILMGALPV